MRRLACELDAALNDDPVVPGLRIPTFLTPKVGGVDLPPPAATADRTCVVLLADDELAAASAEWHDAAVAWRDWCRADANRTFWPVQMSKQGYPIDVRLEGHNFLRAHVEPAQRAFIERHLIISLYRALNALPAEADSPRAPMTVFLSHTKLDLDKGDKVVSRMLAHLNAAEPVKAWFDSGDIEAGSVFEQRIEQGVTDAALLVVLTDSYGSREWCRREVLLAKQHRRPVVVVSALNQREVRSFPYSGNVPVIRWADNPQETLDLLAKEALRRGHGELRLASTAKSGDTVLGAAPELVTVVGMPKGTTVLYPDPPLGAEELTLLARTGVEPITPLQRFAAEIEKLPSTPVVALSMSESDDVEALGLSPAHLDRAMVELTRYLLLAGARLSYAGHLRPGGYTAQLLELIRTHVGRKAANERVLDVWVGWPLTAEVSQKAEYRPYANLHEVPRPTLLDGQPQYPDKPASPPLPAEACLENRIAWARGMSQLRARQTAQANARIAIGGRFGPGVGVGPDGKKSARWYTGRIPGVVEEILSSLDTKQPVFLVGAFGGAARLVSDLIEGHARTEFTWDYQKAAPHSDALRASYGTEWVDYDAMADRLRAGGYAALNNGLSDDENRRLARSPSVDEIVELILKGLRAVIANA